MTSDRTLKLNAQISEEAAEWFVELRTGELDIAARQAFDAWVRTSPEHLRAYLEIAAIWNEGDALDGETDIERLIARARDDDNVVPIAQVSVSQRAAATDAVSTTVADPAPNHVQTGRHTTKRFAFAAAVALFAVAVAALVWSQLMRAPEYVTAIGEQRSITLPDGSTVSLNARSRLRVAFSETERAVDLLEGQALFAVAKQPARPFIVRSNDTHVRAVGTKFDINKKGDNIIVTVVEGKVAVVSVASEPDSSSNVSVTTPALLEAGDRITVAPITVAQSVPPEPVRVDTAAATAWTQRQLVFDAMPLAEVAEEFNRFSPRKIIVEDSESKPLRLSGMFETDPDFFLSYLRARHDITVRESDTEILIVRHE